MTEQEGEKFGKILRESKTIEEVIEKMEKANMDEKFIYTFKVFMIVYWGEVAKLHFSNIPITNDLLKARISRRFSEFYI